MSVITGPRRRGDGVVDGPEHRPRIRQAAGGGRRAGLIQLCRIPPCTVGRVGGGRTLGTTGAVSGPRNLVDDSPPQVPQGVGDVGPHAVVVGVPTGAQRWLLGHVDRCRRSVGGRIHRHRYRCCGGVATSSICPTANFLRSPLDMRKQRSCNTNQAHDEFRCWPAESWDPSSQKWDPFGGFYKNFLVTDFSENIRRFPTD